MKRRLKTCGEWIELFKSDYFDKGGSYETWLSEYHKVLRHLPPGEPLSEPLLHELVRSSKPNSRTRVRYCMVTAKLSKFAGLKYDPTNYKGKYKSTHVRTVPSDRQIVEFWSQVPNPKWQWVIGMMAAYGLRNHEVFRLDYDALRSGDRVVQVLEGKTGPRQVWPFHPEWFERFELDNALLPGVDLGGRNSSVGHSVTKYFSDLSCKFAPYDLRHAYAVRTLEYQIDPSIAARYMGHSREVHERVYRHWIERALLQREYERALERRDRPRPPSI